VLRNAAATAVGSSSDGVAASAGGASAANASAGTAAAAAAAAAYSGESGDGSAESAVAVAVAVASTQFQSSDLTEECTSWMLLARQAVVDVMFLDTSILECQAKLHNSTSTTSIATGTEQHFWK
jgi:hypothetical protein